MPKPTPTERLAKMEERVAKIRAKLAKRDVASAQQTDSAKLVERTTARAKARR